MPPTKATAEQASSDISQWLIAGTRQMEIQELSATDKKIDSPPMRATWCACTFCTPWKSESSAGPCNLASFMTSNVSSAEAIKLSKKENIFYLYKITGVRLR
jgi:hypothetical protein